MCRVRVCVGKPSLRQGDLKEKKLCHRFQQNYMSNLVCEWCAAHRHSKTLNAYDFSLTATWRSTLRSHDDYLADTTACSPWRIVDGWAIERNLLDMLHLIWLGTAKDLSGTLMLQIAWLYMKHWHIDLDNALTHLTWEFKQWCSATSRRADVRPFTQNTILYSPSNYPTLHTRIKAANSRTICLFLCAHTQKLIHGGFDDAPHAADRDTLCSSFVGFCHILDRGGLHLTDIDSALAWNLGHRFLVTYQTLAVYAYCDYLFLYKLRPKFHYMAHLVDRIGETHENPSKIDVFAAESYMGKIKQIGRLCDERTIDTRVAQCLLLYMCIRWSARKRASS